MIITSLLDTDLYKFTMQQLVFHRFICATVQYQFHCRSESVDFQACFDDIKLQIAHLCSVTFSTDEIDYLRSLGFFQEDYLRFLKTFQLDFNHVELHCDPELSIKIKGPWVNTILFETPILAIVNECFYQHKMHALEVARVRLNDKLALIKEAALSRSFQFADFGSRRRFSKVWQQEVLTTIKATIPEALLGTSNVLFAKQLGLRPIGTMAHEYIQAMQVLSPDLRDSQRFAFRIWLEEYQGQLAIALSDTYNTDVFLADFDQSLCEAYQGVRQDSGDPFAFANRFIAQLEKYNIEPKTKTLIFSDSLTFPLMLELYHAFSTKITVGFGIGSNLLNDTGLDAIKIVMKMTYCNDRPVAKLSDSAEKQSVFEQTVLVRLREVFIPKF